MTLAMLAIIFPTMRPLVLQMTPKFLGSVRYLSFAKLNEPTLQVLARLILL